MSDKKVTWTLITGACKGIGKAFAFECASRGMNILLVSNDAETLRTTKAEIDDSFDVGCNAMMTDLTADGAPKEVFSWVNSNGYFVDILINNVGIGKGGTFSKMEIKEAFMIMELNNRVLVEMTYIFLPMLESLEKAHILNMSSLEATLPLPYKAVYTATKNFIYAFSLALNQELKYGNVGVTVVCPGPVLTNTEGLGRMQAHGKRSKLLMMYPGDVARISIRGMLRKKEVIVPGFINSVIFNTMSIVPRRYKMAWLEKLFRVYRT